MGQQGRIRVTFANPVGTATDVMLTSGATGVATVPDHVTVQPGAVAADIKYTAISPGIAVFHATAGPDTQITTASVVDMLRVSSSSGATVEAGAHSIISQSVNISVPDPITLTLMSSQGSIATVDATMTIPVFSQSGLAQITAIAPGASVITASYNGQQATQTIAVIDKARIVQVSGTRLFEVGGHGTAQVSLNAQLANATSLTITPNDPSVVNVPRSFTIPTGSSFASFDVQGMAVGTTNVVFSINGSSGTLPIAVLSKAQLETVSVNGTPSVGDSTQLQVNMDVVVANSHDVVLTSSDPSVITVPTTVTVFAGTSNASVAITPLKAGDAVITATYNGISRQVDVPIGSASYALNLYGQNRYVLGTIGQLSIQTSTSTPTPVTLTSSDPSVVSVPSSIVVNNFSEAAPMTALRSGTATITATGNGASATFPVSIVTAPGIQQFGPSFSVPVNGTGSGYLYLDTQPPIGTTVSFTTSDASIAPAPAPITAINGQTYVPITVHGGNTGTAVLTASVAGSKASAVVYVGGSTANGGVFQGLFNQGISTIELGAATLLVAEFSPAPPNGDTGTITFGTNGILSTPSTTLGISSSSCCNYFPVIGAVAGASDVTVNVGGVSQTTTVTVVSSPTYQLSVPSPVKVGSTVTAHISSNAGLAADRTFALSSSNTNVATVTAATATIGPGSSNLQVAFGVHGVAAGTATITANIKGTNFTATVTVQ